MNRFALHDRRSRERGPVIGGGQVVLEVFAHDTFTNALELDALSSATMLEHSKLERHGEGNEQLRATFDGPGVWGDILALYAKATEGGKR